MLFSGEELKDTRKALHGVGGMQSDKHEVARFSRHQTGKQRFLVAHFSDDNNIRILPDSSAKCRWKIDHVQAHFTLADNAFIRRE